MRSETLTCDLPIGRKNIRPCGETVEDAKPTVFVIEGIEYEAHLCPPHKEGFIDAVGPYLAIASPTVQRSSGKVRKALRGRHGTPFTTREVREWARAQGREVPTAGRLPEPLMEEYADAHGL